MPIFLRLHNSHFFSKIFYTYTNANLVTPHNTNKQTYTAFKNSNSFKKNPKPTNKKTRPPSKNPTNTQSPPTTDPPVNHTTRTTTIQHSLNADVANNGPTYLVSGCISSVCCTPVCNFSGHVPRQRCAGNSNARFMGRPGFLCVCFLMLVSTFMPVVCRVVEWKVLRRERACDRIF